MLARMLRLDDDDIGMDPPGAWVWRVLPRSAELPMIGTGTSDSERSARKAVEEMLAGSDLAECGLLDGPNGQCYRCLRGRKHGGLVWLECAPSAPGVVA